MGADRRLTLQTQMVLRVLLDSPQEEQYGLEIARQSGLASGTIYPILARLEDDGWLESGWEDIDESREGRRKRRYYRVTGYGLREARRALAITKRLIFPRLAGASS